MTLTCFQKACDFIWPSWNCVNQLDKRKFCDVEHFNVDWPYRYDSNKPVRNGRRKNMWCDLLSFQILRSMLYRGSEIMREVGWVVFDEIHYMRDKGKALILVYYDCFVRSGSNLELCFRVQMSWDWCIYQYSCVTYLTQCTQPQWWLCAHTNSVIKWHQWKIPYNIFLWDNINLTSCYHVTNVKIFPRISKKNYRRSGDWMLEKCHGTWMWLTHAWSCSPERGVVWEETIILLPDNVHYVFLSATIPNARQFAEWICHLHKQVSHVKRIILRYVNQVLSIIKSVIQIFML